MVSSTQCSLICAQSLTGWDQSSGCSHPRKIQKYWGAMVYLPAPESGDESRQVLVTVSEGSTIWYLFQASPPYMSP